MHYRYDKEHRITHITYPSGRTVDIERDVLGHVTGMKTNQQTLVSQVRYLHFGPLTELQYSNNTQLKREYDESYRLLSQQHLETAHYQWSPNDNMTVIYLSPLKVLEVFFKKDYKSSHDEI